MAKTLNDLTSRPGFFLIAGPCVIEGEEMAFEIGRHIKSVCEPLGIPFAFKGSYRKANRSRLDSFTGIGDIKALKILNSVGRELGVPVVTDIHLPEEAQMAADFVDILQIPAFLCRQTDLLIAAARTGKSVNIKKGQFLSPESMRSRKSGQQAMIRLPSRSAAPHSATAISLSISGACPVCRMHASVR